MTLIVVLLVLFTEHMLAPNRYWQAGFYTDKMFSFMSEQKLFKDQASAVGPLLLVLLPALILYVVLHSIDSHLLRLITDSVILMVCIGCPQIRATYKSYLQAANRGDFVAADHFAEEIGHQADSDISFGQHLVWINYQHYAAVIIWFAVLGPAGSVLYVLARNGQKRWQQGSEPDQQTIDKLMAILDWIPVRITALGLLLVGHFSRALSVWLNYLTEFDVPARVMLVEVATAAEQVEPDEQDCTEEPCTLVRLAKRNVMFLVVLISVLSLSGWIR